MKTFAFAVCVVVASGSIATAAYPPTLLHYQGVLRDASDRPLSGAYPMVFRLFSGPVEGDEIFVDTHAAVAVARGLFSVDVGGGVVSDGTGPGAYAYLPNVFADYREVYLEVEIQGERLAPRTRVTSSAWALNARFVNGVEIATPTPLDLWVDAATGSDNYSGLSPAAPKRTIQAAIDRIPSVLNGDVTVHIAPGTYVDPVVLADRLSQNESRIRLLGSPENPSAVRLDGQGSIQRVVSLHSVRNVSLEGLEIRGAAGEGLFVLSSSGITVLSCVLADNSVGSLVTRSWTSIEATTIRGQAGSGLACTAGSRCVLAGGTDIRSNAHGVWVDRAGQVLFAGGAAVTSNALTGLTAFNSGVVDLGGRSDVEVSGNGQNLEARAHGIVRDYGNAIVGDPQCAEHDLGLCRPWGL